MFSAAQMPQLDKQIITTRTHALRQLGDEQLVAHIKNRVGTTDMLLLESDGRGHLSSFEAAQLIMSQKNPSKPPKKGQLLPVMITNAKEGVAEVTPLVQNRQYGS